MQSYYFLSMFENLAKSFSDGFDNHGVAVRSVDRMATKASGHGFTLKRLLTAVPRAIGKAFEGVFGFAEDVFGNAGDNGLGVQRALTEVPTGLLFEGARRGNVLTAGIWNTPAKVMGWFRKKCAAAGDWGAPDAPAAA